MSGTCPETTISPFRDVGKSINNIASRRLLKEGTLFACGPLTYATDADWTFLRNGHRVSCLFDLNPLPPPQSETSLEGVVCQPTCRAYASDSSRSIMSYGVDLRSTRAYSRQLSGRFPIWLKWRIFLHILSLGQSHPSVPDSVAAAIYSRGAIQETIDILDASFSEIGVLLNTLSRDMKTYPVLLCGHASLRNQNLLVFLLLSALAIPIDFIQDDIATSIDEFEPVSHQSEGETEFLKDIVKTKTYLITALHQHLTKRYGSVDGYLGIAGMGSAARDRLKSIFLTESESELVVV